MLNIPRSGPDEAGCPYRTMSSGRATETAKAMAEVTFVIAALLDLRKVAMTLNGSQLLWDPVQRCCALRIGILADASVAYLKFPTTGLQH